MSSLALTHAGPTSGGAPSFDPLSLSPWVWYDAADTASITQSSGAVSQWNDKSGAARHLVQATGGKQPITNTRTLNGLNVLDYDGVDDALAVGAQTQAQPLTVFCVLKGDVVTGQRDPIGYNGSLGLIRSDGATWNTYAGSTLNWGVAPNTSAHVLEVVVNGASTVDAVDGTAGTPGNPGAAGLAGTTLYVGTDQSAGGPWDGMMAEILIYPSALSAGNRSSVRGYLGGKWGITVA